MGNQEPLSLRNSFLPLLPEHSLAADLLSEAADDVLADRLTHAASLIQRADMAALQQFASRIIDQVADDIHRFRVVEGAPPRTTTRASARMPSKAISLGVFERDGWRCRYCETRIVSFDAINVLNKLFPSLVRRNGPAKRMHGGMRALAASLDHILPHSRSGTNEPANLVASCHPCQFGRNQWTLAEVGFFDPRDRRPIVDGWDGLTRLLTKDASEVILNALERGLPDDINSNSFAADDPSGATRTDDKI